MLHNKGKFFLTTKDFAVIGMMAAMLEVVKLALTGLPNIELVTLLIIIFTLFLGWKSVIAVVAFVLMECTIYGFGLWTIMYFYVWPLLVLLTLLVKKFNSKIVYTLLSAMFGFFFGALCAIPYLFIGGPYMAFTWWIAGIPYDIIHGVSNLILCLVLFTPLNSILNRLKKENIAE